MLAADKAALHSVLEQQSLQIREKELRFFTDQFSAVAGQAAMLAGFQIHAMYVVYGDEARVQSSVLRALYYSLSTAPAFFHLKPSQNRCLRLVMLTPLDQLENSEMIERRRGPDECFILESTLAPHREHESHRFELDIDSETSDR